MHICSLLAPCLGKLIYICVAFWAFFLVVSSTARDSPTKNAPRVPMQELWLLPKPRGAFVSSPCVLRRFVFSLPVFSRQLKADR